MGGVMTGESARRLAEAFVAWQRRRNLSLAHIARHGKVARNTLEYLRKGTAREISRPTLRKIANGLATEPYPPYPRDASMADQIYRDLHRAAGYGDVESHLPDTFLEQALFYRLGTLERAHAWQAAIERLACLEPAEIASLGPAGKVKRRRTDPSTE
jgi:transcriptional regulator with XRE-family HTH domain